MSSIPETFPHLGIDAATPGAPSRPTAETPVAAAIAQAYPSPARRRSKFRVPYLAERAGWYFFIRRFPRNLREAGLINQALCRIGLRTRELATAQRLARALAHRFDEVVQRLEQRQARGDAQPPPHPGAELADQARDGPVAAFALLEAHFEVLGFHDDENGPRVQSLPANQIASAGAAQTLALPESPPDRVEDEFEPLLDLVDGFVGTSAALPTTELKAYQDLCRLMMSGHLRALRLVLSRLDEPSGASATTIGQALTLPVTPKRPLLAPQDDYDDLARAFEHWTVKARPAPKTIMELRPVWTRLQQVTGKSRISDLTREDLLTFQASELARRRGGEQTRPQTVNKKFALMAAVFNLVHADVLEARGIANPIKNLRKAKVRGDDYIDKQDFSTEELLALFGGPVHRNGQRPKGGAGEAAFWMPALGYAIGCRQSELAQVAMNEVLQRDGIWCLWLTSRQEESSQAAGAATELEAKPTRQGGIDRVDANARQDIEVKRSQKTGSSRRIIPIHPDILKLGFLDFVECNRNRGASRLFPDIRADNKGTLAGNFSKWFNGYLAKVGIKRRGLDWISFRHSFKTACRTAEIEQDMADYIEGHTAKRVSQNYGRFTTRALFDAMSRMELPGLKGIPPWRPPGVPAKTAAVQPQRGARRVSK